MSVPQLAIHMQKSFYSVSEADGSVEVCAEVTTQQFEGSIQVNYSTAGGSAEGLCYYLKNNTCSAKTMLHQYYDIQTHFGSYRR